MTTKLPKKTAQEKLDEAVAAAIAKRSRIGRSPAFSAMWTGARLPEDRT